MATFFVPQASLLRCPRCHDTWSSGHNYFCSFICVKCGFNIQNPTHECEGNNECYYEGEPHDDTHDVTKCARCKRSICLHCPDYNFVWCDKIMDLHCVICVPDNMFDEVSEGNIQKQSC